MIKTLAKIRTVCVKLGYVPSRHTQAVKTVKAAEAEVAKAGAIFDISQFSIQHITTDRGSISGALAV